MTPATKTIKRQKWHSDVSFKALIDAEKKYLEKKYNIFIPNFQLEPILDDTKRKVVKVIIHYFKPEWADK